MNHLLCGSLTDTLYHKKVAAQSSNIRMGNFVLYVQVQSTAANGRLSTLLPTEGRGTGRRTQVWK